MIPYGTQWIDDDDVAAVSDVLKNGNLTQGPCSIAFEQALAKAVGAKYCVVFSNATAGLHCAVKALGLPAGTEGITTPNTFVASANCMAYNNMIPVFADINPKTYNVTAETIRACMTENTRLLIPVHFAGQACPMSEIGALARANNLRVIEDAAHAIGSCYEDGAPVGCCSNSDMTVFSFHPVKTITCGEGGAVTTNDSSLYNQLLLFRSHGITKDPTHLLRKPSGSWYYEMQELGFNYRMTELQAALGYSQLAKLQRFKARRREIIAKYNDAFRMLPCVSIPSESKGLSSCFHLYVVRIDFKKLGRSRKIIMKQLADLGVGTQVLYIPVYTQPWYELTYGVRNGLCPQAEAYYAEALALPLYPKLSDVEVKTVIDAVSFVIGGEK